MVVFIDESGTLPDIADKYIVLVALVSHHPEELAKIIPKFRRKIPVKGKRKLKLRGLKPSDSSSGSNRSVNPPKRVFNSQV